MKFTPSLWIGGEKKDFFQDRFWSKCKPNLKKTATMMCVQSHRSFPAFPISSSSCSSIRIVTSSGVIPVVLTSVRVNSRTILRFCSLDSPFLVFRITTGMVWFTVVPEVLVKWVFSTHPLWSALSADFSIVLTVHVHVRKVNAREIRVDRFLIRSFLSIPLLIICFMRDSDARFRFVSWTISFLW